MAVRQLSMLGIAIMSVVLLTTGNVIAEVIPSYADISISNVVSSAKWVGYGIVVNGMIPKTSDSYVNSQEAFGYAWIEAKELNDGATSNTVFSIIMPGGHWRAYTGTVTASNGIECISTLDLSDASEIHLAGRTMQVILDRNVAPFSAKGSTISFVLEADDGCPQWKIVRLDTA